MQRTLDSFFKRTGDTAKKAVEVKKSPPRKKRKVLVISSDEEEIPESPQVSKTNEHKKTRTETTRISPAQKQSPIAKFKVTPKKPRLQVVDPSTLFGVEPQRVEAKQPPKPKEKALLEMEDEDINRSLMEVDVDASLLELKENGNGNFRVKTPSKSPANKLSELVLPSATEKPEKSPSKEDKTPKSERKSSGKEEKSNKKEEKSTKKEEKSTKKEEKSTKKEEKSSINLEKSPQKEKKSPRKSEQTESAKEKEHTKSESKEHAKKTTPKSEKTIDHEDKDTPKSEQKTEKQQKSTPKIEKKETKDAPRPHKEMHADMNNSTVLSDEERFERKRSSYQSYVNRASCLNPGSKEVPKGKPNCLAGLNFIVTGVLESLMREEAEDIVKQYGGKVMTTVGKRLNYVIAGEEAGYSKLGKAEQHNIPVISEDDFFDLIRTKSGNMSKTNGDVEAADTKAITSPKAVKNTAEIKTEKLAVTPEKKRKLAPSSETKVKAEILDAVQVISDIESEAQPHADTLAWVDKYKPKTVKDIIGQQGAASNLVKLTNWLSKWYTNHDGKKKLSKPSPWAKNDDGSFFKAALLSGPPGVGKTTTATLVCKQLGFDTVEFNASDTRSKRLLKEEVSELLSNKSLYGYFYGKGQAVTKKHVLIMDEVDGMAGNEDRGGIQELIALIKDSSVPIICMCNDRNHQKMRSLVNHCYDLRFNKPMLKQIKGYIMSICCKEKLKLDSAKVDEIITATNNDIRQTINHLSLLSAGKELNLKSDESAVGESGAQRTAQKDLKIGPWDVVRKVFSAEEHKLMSFQDKNDLFFNDYSLAPLFVQQNYLQVSPHGPKSDVLQKIALTADALSLGDLVDKRIRSSNAWSLLPTQAFFSSVLPGEYMSGHFTGQINFPAWLGKNSRSSKLSRLAQELHNHTRLRTSGSRQSVRLDYAPHLLASIVRPLKEQANEGVQQALDVLKEYHLLREDVESLIELTNWPGKKAAMDAVDGRVKAALTRAYNKEVLAYTYSAAAGVKKKKASALDDAELAELAGEDGEAAVLDTDEEQDDDLEHDGLIKAKKKPSNAASTSKAKTSTTNKKTSSAAGKTKASAAKSKK